MTHLVPEGRNDCKEAYTCNPFEDGAIGASGGLTKVGDGMGIWILMILALLAQSADPITRAWADVRECVSVEKEGLPADPREEVEFRRAFVKVLPDGTRILIIGPSFLPPSRTGGKPVIVIPPDHQKPRILRHELIHWLLWRQTGDGGAEHPREHFHCEWGKE